MSSFHFFLCGSVCFSKQCWRIRFVESAFRAMIITGDFYYDELTFVDAPRRYMLTVTHPDKLNVPLFPGWAQRRFSDFVVTYIKTTSRAGETATPLILTLYIERAMDYNTNGHVEYKQIYFCLKASYTVSRYQEETEEIGSMER